MFTDIKLITEKDFCQTNEQDSLQKNADRQTSVYNIN